MNAPVLLAQLSGSTPQAAATPKNLKLEKPSNGQAVTVHLDGNTKLDFSDIASEKLTFVKVGEKLIVLFDNQSTVTIEPVFDSMGRPLPEIAFLVGQDRTVTGDEFAALFPITTDQSVLPAAGGTGGTAAGANFSDVTVGALDANGNPLALLGNEEFGGAAFATTDAGNPRPIFRGAGSADLDDEGLAEGNLDGPGDAPGNATSVTRSLNVDFGTDRANASFAFSATQPSLTGLTSGGQAVNLFVGLVGGVPTIIGYVGADQNDLASQVFTVTINSATLQGEYTFTLLRPLDHSQHGTEDTLNLTIEFSATDGSGDTGTDIIRIHINDDSPVIIPEQVDNPISETPPSTLQDPVGGVSERSGTLGISWGADRFNDHVNGGVSATTGQNGDRSVVFTTNNTVALTGHVQGSGEAPNVAFGALLSQGKPVSFVVLNNGTVLLAYTGEAPPNLPGTGSSEGENGGNFVSPDIVFIATLSDDTNSGSYTIKQYQELDHKSGDQTFDSLNLLLNYIATDSDGDPIEGTLTLTVNDDTPSITVTSIENSRVYEDALLPGNIGNSYSGIPNEGDTTTGFGHLGVQWGADNTDVNDTLGKQDGAVSGSADNAALTGRAIYFTNTTITANNVAVDAGHPLLSHGETVLFKLDDSGATLIGYTGSGATEQTVFTVSLSDDGDGTYTFNLIGVLDHPVPNSEDDIALQFNFTARDFDGDTVSSTFKVTVNDDAPIQSQEMVTGAVNENDLANFNPFYPVLFDFWQGSLGTSPYDGGTGVLGTVPAYGNISSLVLPGADGPGAFHLVSENVANAILTATEGNIGVGGGALFSHGNAIDHVQSVNIPSIGDVMGFFASDGRLVFGLLVDAEGNYNFRLFDQIDHPVGDNPTTSAFEAVRDVFNIDLSRFVTYTDFDGDTITLAGGAFSVNVTDDAPVVVGRETGLVNENDLADFNPLYPLVFDFWQGSLGTSPFDGFTDDGSITGLLGTVPVYGFLTDNVLGGADEFGKFDLVSEQAAATLLATLNGGAPFTSHGDVIDHAESINIPSLGEAMGFFASDGRLVFGLFVSEGGFYNFRLFDQLDHGPNLPGLNGAPVADADTLYIDLSKFVTFTDADGDAIDLGTDIFVISVVDDIPVLTGQSVTVTLDEGDLNNFIPGWDLIPAAIKAVFPIEGSAGTSPDSDTDALLFNSTGKQGFLNEIIGTNLVNGGADEFGKFALVTVTRADYLLTNELAGWTSKGEAINHVQTLSLGLLGDVMGFFAGDRLVFTLTINSTGFYDLRLFDQVDHFGANGESINLDLSKFVTYTDFDGDAIDLGTGHFVLSVLDDAPIATGAVVTGTVEEEQIDPINSLLGGDLLHGNEDQGSLGGDDLDTSSNPLATTNVTLGSLATLVKVGADENGTFSFDTSIAGQAVKDSTGAAITSRGHAVEYGFRNGQLVGFVDLNNNNAIDGSERIVFTVSLSELPFGIPLPVPAGLLDGIANDQFTFTLLDQIDHANPNGASTEDIKNIDLSSTIKFTDADGDKIGFVAHSFEIKVIDDTPVQLAGKFEKKTVEEEHRVSSIPGLDHGNEDFGPDPQDGDKVDSLFGFPFDNFGITLNTASGNLGALVSVGADESDRNLLILPRGTFALATDTSGLPEVYSKGEKLVYVVTDTNGDLLGDTLTATAGVGGRVVFTLSLVSNGNGLAPLAGDYTFTLRDQLDHPAGGGENLLNIDFSSVIRFSDFDGDTITLTPGSFTIDVIDDQPVSKGDVPASKTLDDEAQLLFTPANTANGGGSDISSNEKSTAGNAGALFSIGADDVGTVTMNAFPAFKVIFKDGNGFAGSESVVWGTTPTVGSDGATTWTATSPHYDSGHPAAVLTIRMDGSYTFTVNAPVVHGTNSSSNEEDLSIKFEYTATDFDQDSVTGSLTIKIDDDMPTSRGDVIATTKADDEAQLVPFTGNDTPADGVANVKTVSNATAGALFSAGSDGVQSIAITTQPIFSAIYKDANGVAKTEATTWSASPVIGSDGSATWTATGNATNAVVATLKIGVDGSYSFAVSAPLVHPTNSATEEDLPLKFSYTVTDGDGDTITGSLTINVNDDTPIVASSQPVSPAALDDDAQIVFVGNPGGTGDVDNATTAAGNAGALFTAGADGFKAVSAAPPAFNVIYNANGFAVTEQATWTLTSTAPNGTTTWTASSGHYETAATLVINANGSYSFTLNAPVKNDATSSTSEENLTISIPYTVTDGDGDTASGTLRILVNDDTPKPAIVAGNVVIADETALVQGGTNDVPLSPAPAILPANFISLATSAAGFVTIAAGADGIKAVALTNAAGGNLVNVDSDLRTLDGTKILLSTDATNPNLVIGKAGSVTALAIFIDPLTGAVSVAEYVAIKHPITNDHNDPVSLASVVFVTVTDGDSDKATTATAIQVTIRDDGPVVGSPEAKTVDETTLPGATTVHGSLNVNFGTDGPASFASAPPAITTANFNNFPQGGGTLYNVGTYAFSTNQGIANHLNVDGQLYGTNIGVTNSAGPFTVTTLSLGLFGQSNTGKGDITLTGVPAAGGSPITVLLTDVILTSLGSPITSFDLSNTALAGIQLSSLTIKPVLPGAMAFNGSVVVDNVALGSGGGGIGDGPVTFANQASAIANIHLFNNQGGGVDHTTLTSHGLTLQYKLLDAVTLVAYTGATPTSIGSAGVVFSVVLSQNGANPNGAYDFKLLQSLDDFPGGVTDLKFTFDFKVKDGDGDTTSNTFNVTVHDSVPTIGVPDSKTIDEEGLVANTATHDAPYNGDVPGIATTAVGSLAINWGSDNNNTGAIANRSVQFVGTLNNTDPAGLLSDGVQVHYTLSSNNSVLTATKGVGGPVVFTVTLDDITGQYTFVLKDNLTHNGINVEDNIALTFGFTATDSDGDTTNPSSFTVTVNDDAPALTGTPTPGAVSEALFGNDPAGPLVQVTSQPLKVAYGADGGAQFVKFALDANGDPLHPAGLTSDGVALKYIIRTIGSGEQQLVAFKDGQSANQPVFIVELTSPTSPYYTFTLWQNLDHVGAGNNTSLALGFSVVASDGDKDTVTQTFTVNVADSGPALTGTPVTGAVSEAGLPFVASDFQSLKIAFGADGPSAHLTFARDISGDPVHPAGLKSDGVPLLYAIRLAASGEEQLVAYKQGQTADQPVFIVELSTPANPTYIFTLYQNLDHTGANGGTLPLGFSVVGTDFDGDSVVQTFTVNVADDTPTAQNISGAITENESKTFTLVSGVDYSFGADGGAITLGAPSYSNVPAGVVLEAPVVTLGVDGHSIVVGGGFDALSLGATAVLNIPYTVTDGDGDAVTKTLSVTITGTNDAPVITSGASASEDENTPASNVVYQITATDADAGASLTYSLTGVDKDRFNVDANGNVRFKVSPDYEAPTDAGPNNVYNIDVNVSDGITTTTKSVAITVNNVNENVAPDAVNDTLSFGGVGSPTPPGGTSGWTQFGGHYYKIVEGNFTWDQARAGALAAGGYLVNITSAAENNFIVNQLNIGYNSEFNNYYSKSPYIWIGASDSAAHGTSEGRWVWVDGPEAGQVFWQGESGGTAIGYASWGMGEPNNWAPAENYGMILTVFGSNWNDGTGTPGGSPGEYTGYVIEYGGGGGNGGVSEDVVTTFDTSLLLANDTDQNGDTLTVTSVSGTGFSLSGTTVTFNPTGIASLQALNVGESADVSFTYTISDGHSGTDTATATLKVNGVNDAAVITGTSSGTVTEAVTGGSAGTPSVTGDLFSDDVDNPDDAWQVISTATGSANGYGTFTVTAAGVWTYTLNNANAAVNNLNNGLSLNDSFTVLTADGTSKLVSILINGATDPSVPATVTTYNYGQGNNNSAANAYDLTNLIYAKSSDPEVMYAATMPSLTVSAQATNNQTDYYKITIAASNTRVVFDIDHGMPSLDSWLRLYKSNNPANLGSIFDYNNDFDGSLSTTDSGSTSGWDSYLDVTLSAGTYYLQVGRSNAAGTVFQNFNNSATYELQVSIKPPGVDPIVLDLGAPGIDLSSANDGVAFDLDADGVKEQIGWTKGQDGLLVSDLDGSGKIENGSEVFSPFFKGGSFASALEALATLDSNHDGRIDSADADFGKISVWQDLNHDGITDAGEMQSLTDLGITAIPLNAVAGGNSINGQPVISQGSFEKADGTTGTLIEVEFQHAVEPVQTAVQDRGIQQGHEGADKFELAGAFNTILDYNAGQGDVIDISALLKGTSANAANIDNFVHLEQSGNDVKIQIDTAGTGNFSGGSHDVATLQGYGTSNADIVRIALQNMEHQIAV